MADYRGGDRRTSVHGDRLVNAIENGRTEKQRQRNFEQKLVFAGLQAALQGVRGGLEHSRQFDKDEAARTLDARREAQLLKGVDSKVPDYVTAPTAEGDGRLPAWLVAEQGGPAQDARYDIDPPMTAAEDALKDFAAKPKPAVTWGVDDDDERTGGRGMMRSQR